MEELLNKAIEERISEDIDRMIEEKVEEFRRELTYNKNKYMADIMNSISILYSQDPAMNSMNYKIIFENVIRLEKKI